jgi:hypothetical protein
VVTIDWSKAPEGATHCDETNGRWYKNEADVWKFYYGCSWIAGCNRPGFGAELTPRPVVTRAGRSKLPPVGTEVEAQDGYSWKIGTVVAHVWEACFGDMVIIQCEGFWAARRADGIRPVKTERERAIEEMLKVMRYDEDDPLSHKGMAGALFDAGYRKGEPT